MIDWQEQDSTAMAVCGWIGRRAESKSAVSVSNVPWLFGLSVHCQSGSLGAGR